MGLATGTHCGNNLVNGPLDGVTIDAGHEIAEANTDVIPGAAWVDASPDRLETGDKCQYYNLKNVAFSTGTFPVQPLGHFAGFPTNEYLISSPPTMVVE